MGLRKYQALRFVPEASNSMEISNVLDGATVGFRSFISMMHFKHTIYDRAFSLLQEAILHEYFMGSLPVSIFQE